MRKDQNLPQQRVIGRPFCEVCKAQMWLACIEPDKPDYDKRTFECPVCPHAAERTGVHNVDPHGSIAPAIIGTLKQP